jgi:peptidoglycan/LPS O-acetylase OafA/YrhL
MFKISKEIRGKNISYRPELDGIRALAIVVVLLHHLGYLGGRGFLGVDIFFTLSGYLITQVLLATVAKGKPLLSFYRRRIARLYPIMVISVFVATAVIGYQASRDNEPILASLFYYKNFLHWGDLFGPFWSLSAEEQFYLLFPITLILFYKFANRKVFTTFLIVVIAAVWSYVLWHNYPDYSWNQDGVFNLAVFRPTMILVGCVLSLNYEWVRNLVKKTRILVAALFIVLVVLCIHMQFPGLASLSTTLLIVLLDREVAEHSLVSRWVRALLSFAPIRTLGILSYSIYIWHMPVIFYFYNHNHDPRHLVPLVFAIVLAIALVSFYLVEVPLQAFLKGSRKVVPLGEA